jgi:prolipoprotein diacylglyceryltransferase
VKKSNVAKPGSRGPPASGETWTLAPGTLPLVFASVSLDFNPTASLFGADFRLETLALAGTIFLVLIMIGLSAGRRGAGLFAWDSDPSAPPPARLRRDDLILIAFGVVPGAVVGGRLGYVLVHLDYYQTHTSAILDVNQGGLNLTLGVVLGTITGAAVGRLMAAPLGRWLAVSAIPVMFGLGLGKLATVLGGAGQGSYSDASWATSYAGSGPWESLNPSYPALPSQALEAGLVLAAMLAMLLVPPLIRLRLRPWGVIVRPGLAPRHPWRWLTGGRRFLTMLGLWAAMRFVAAFTWRDAHVLGSLGAEQLVLLGVVAFAALGPIALALTAWTLRHLARALVGGWRRYRAARLASRPPGPARAAVAANDSKLQTASGAQTKGAWGSASAAADYANDVKLPVEDPLGTPPVPPV